MGEREGKEGEKEGEDERERERREERGEKREEIPKKTCNKVTPEAISGEHRIMFSSLSASPHSSINSNLSEFIIRHIELG
jgi:hypothetical protein